MKTTQNFNSECTDYEWKVVEYRPVISFEFKWLNLKFIEVGGVYFNV